MRPCSPRPRLARSLPRPDSNSCIKALEILESSTAFCTMSSWIRFHQDTFSEFFSFSVPLKSLDHSSFESKFFFPPWCVPWNPSAASQKKQRARHRSNPAWVPNVFSPKVNKKTSSADKCSSAAWIQAFLWSALFCWAPSFSYWEMTSSRWSGWTSDRTSPGSPLYLS